MLAVVGRRHCPTLLSKTASTHTHVFAMAEPSPRRLTSTSGLAGAAEGRVELHGSHLDARCRAPRRRSLSSPGRLVTPFAARQRELDGFLKSQFEGSPGCSVGRPPC